MSADPDDFDLQMTTALREVEAIRRKGLLWLGALVTGVVAALAGATVLGAKDASLIVLVLAIALGGTSVFGWTRGAHKKRIMPLLARQLGLTYSSPGAAIAERIPALLLPAEDVTCDDLIQGALVARDIWLADVVVRESSRDRVVLFNGFVISVELAAPAPGLVISDRHYLGVWPEPDRAGLTRRSEVPASHRRIYAVYAEADGQVPDSETLTALIDLENLFGIGARLAALRVCDGRLTLAVRQSDHLFQIGGLLRTPARLHADMRAALPRLSLLLSAAAAILALEPRLQASPAIPSNPSPAT